ncbi:dihydrofolate reductase family protein [Micromonospora sp. WMMD1102]|uniref:dihydrofolate reductase family protein n=1 Tax=Micromonospora sp. WMMD1102 TaxID=3016105 RepID=UPI0024154435|nr:dihydrofolate reductase family protein [Micromonospora sp. WMMD1102]MDG4791761.1 dihydrofolate reductase family protein [Micromonospora sp. WMMD1102]
MSQELMVDFITSLDGYGAAKGWPAFWGLEGPEYLGWLEEDSKIERTLLMGSATYRLMHGAAASRPDDPDPLGAAPKIVFSSTLDEPLEWANTRLIRGDAVEAVRTLKEESDRPLSTLGSLSLCRSLLAAGLVDRYRVVVFPVVTGATGRERIYDGWPDVGLDLTEAQTFDKGTQLLDYVPRLLDGPIHSGTGAG